MFLRFAFTAIITLSLCIPVDSAEAHYCSNIFAAHARLIVKPETTTVNISGGSAKLNVYLQNNFPYKLFSVQMRGSASGYTINVSPSSQTVHPGQKVLYTYTISGAAGSVQASQLNLQVRIRIGSWRGSNDQLVNENPSQSTLIAATSSTFDNAPGEQSQSLNAATLADKYSTAKLSSSSPFFGRTGIQQLIHWFGYRFCYNASGDWRCSSQDCPSPCAVGSAWTSIDNFPQDCLRAGVDLAVRKTKLGTMPIS